MTSTATASPPVLARALIVGTGIMSLANSVTVPFLAVYLRRELGLQPGVIGSFVGLYFSHGVLAAFVLNATMALSSSSFGPVGKALLSDLLPPGRRVKWFSYQYMTTNRGYAVGGDQPTRVVGTGYAGEASSGAVRWTRTTARKRVCGGPTTPVIRFLVTCGACLGGQPVAGRLWTT